MLKAIESILLLNRLRINVKRRRADLERIQKEKLKTLLKHAYDNVPYYQRLFRSVGVSPDHIETVGDLRKIPTTSKPALQALDLEEILAQGADPEPCVIDVTSGSTGIPLRVYFTPKDYLIRSLVFLRTFMETGYRLTDRQAVVCDTRFVSEKSYWFQNLGIFRKRYIPVQLELEKQIEILRRFRPNYIHGYPLSLAAIAAEVLRRGINDISPSMICTGAELVSKKTREVINRAFGVKMVDTYATIESGLIAWQCEQRKGYHINIDSVVLEVIHNGRPARPGERGTAVITNLHSYAMPIIRYELGDVCIPAENTCPCGRELPLISLVEGRMDDMIWTPSGNMVSPNSITNAMEEVEGIRQFRVIQETEKRLLVQLAQGKGFTEGTPDRVARLLGELVGSDMKVSVEVRPSIPEDHSKKQRAVISKISKAT